MKKGRGRPRGKVFPQQDNLLKGRLVATYGKIGESEEMVIATCCPSYIHDDSKFKELLPIREKWDRKIGSIIRQKIISRDHEFFRRMADSVEALAKFNGYTASPTRSHAVWYKIICHLRHEPFTLMGLRNYYKERGHIVDSSTLSKIL